MKHPIVSATLILATLTTTTTSRAESAAATLFADGKSLLAEGHAVEACEKFEQSNRLEPGIGVRFHLARCHERIGRTAAAWTGYLEVAKASHAQGQVVREKLARSLATALEPRLNRIVMEVRGERTEGLTIMLDGTAVDRNAWATPIVVDPGTVTLEASAPGKKPWRTVLEISGDKREWPAVVPELEAREPARTPERATIAAVSVPRTTTEQTRSGPIRTVGFVFGGAAVVALGTGGAFALLAMSQDSRAKPHCNGTVCDRDGVSLRGDALTSGNMSTVGFSVGAALLASGVTLYLLSPRRDTPVEVRAGLGHLAMRAQW